MASDWYYTTNKQQMGPVSWDELRHLADRGLLKPHDMVWTEGMAEWVKAIRQDGLFAEGGAAAPPAAEAPPPPRRRARRYDDEDEEEDEDDRPRRRKKAAASGGMAVGLKIGLAVGGALFLIFVLVCGVVGIYWLGSGGGAAGPSRYTINLAPRTRNDRVVQFQAGQRVTVSVSSSVTIRRTDVDLAILRQNGQVIASDVDLDHNPRVTFVAPANENYTIRVINLGPGTATCRVNY